MMSFTYIRAIMKIKINNIIFIIIGALTLTSCQTLNNYGFSKMKMRLLTMLKIIKDFLQYPENIKIA